MSLFLNIPTAPGFAMPRSYIRGISIDANLVSGPTWVDNVVSYKDTFNVDYVVTIEPSFYEWSSNVYTLGWFVDIDNSHCYINGVEVIAGWFTDVGHVVNEEGFWILVQSGGGAGTVYKHALPPPPPEYWLKF